ncbi:MAG: nucleoside:proton symporter [Bradyrhizobiaceae bacterium]|nr:nucleoside:proton symporter [Bradyrhizobiaceae bacterium]
MVGQGLIGIIVILALAWVAGERRKKIAWRIVGGGLGLQVALAVVLIWLPPTRGILSGARVVVDGLQAATRAGTSFVFGYLGGGEAPFAVVSSPSTFVLAFQALPLILLVSALSTLLFYWRVLQPFVKGFGWILGRSIGVGGAVGVAAALKVFLGMIEAPLLIRPYLAGMSRGGLFAVMACGLATIAGTVFVVYATILGPVIPDAAGHLFTASLLNAPAALTIAALMIPPEGDPTVLPPIGRSDVHSSMEAVMTGTVEGVWLVINVTAMLIVMIALVALANQILSVLPNVAGAPLTLQRAMGWFASPFAWSLGIPWNESSTAGELIGVKVILNEFIAYVDLAALPRGTLSQKTEIILTYAMCGFANIGSLGILIGGLTTMVPDRRAEIVAMGWRAVLAGLLASSLTGALVGLFL